MPTNKPIEIYPIKGIPEVRHGDNVGQIILDACKKSRFPIRNKDILVVTHKIVSKAEGRVVDLSTVTPSKFALKVARHIGMDARQVELILSESRRIVKMVKGLIISETAQGFVCANAGVDQSNVERGKIILLPKKPDHSAMRIRNEVKRSLKKDVAVINSDTFGRPWREGQVDIAIGLSGLNPFSDYRGRRDQYGYDLKATVICVADELASSAELCMNKLDRVPVALIRGYEYMSAEVPSRALTRSPTRDLFR